MEKILSYYDWNKKFKKKDFKSAAPKNYKQRVNSLGIPQEEFRSFLRSWVSKNLL